MLNGLSLTLPCWRVHSHPIFVCPRLAGIVAHETALVSHKTRCATGHYQT